MTHNAKLNMVAQQLYPERTGTRHSSPKPQHGNFCNIDQARYQSKKKDFWPTSGEKKICLFIYLFSLHKYGVIGDRT